MHLSSIHILDKNLVITVHADVPAPNGAGTSACTVMTKTYPQFLQLSLNYCNLSLTTNNQIDCRNSLYFVVLSLNYCNLSLTKNSQRNCWKLFVLGGLPPTTGMASHHLAFPGPSISLPHRMYLARGPGRAWGYRFLWGGTAHTL